MTIASEKIERQRQDEGRTPATPAAVRIDEEMDEIEFVLEDANRDERGVGSDRFIALLPLQPFNLAIEIRDVILILTLAEDLVFRLSFQLGLQHADLALVGQDRVVRQFQVTGQERGPLGHGSDQAALGTVLGQIQIRRHKPIQFRRMGCV